MAKKSTTPDLPTFPRAPHFWGDEETGQPERLSPDELEIDECNPLRLAREAVDQYATWIKVQENPAEAEARQHYAENAARHLVGVFPNTRINLESYATAAGEELAGYSADIVKQVAQRARRTLKTLPPLALLVAWCEAESEKRLAQLQAYRDDLRAYEWTLETGKHEAAKIAEDARNAGLQVSAEAVARVYRDMTWHSIGIKPRCMPPTGRLWEPLQRRLTNGEAEALHVFRKLDAVALRYEAIDPVDESEAAVAERGAVHDERAALMPEVAACLGRPWPDNEPQQR